MVRRRVLLGATLLAGCAGEPLPAPAAAAPGQPLRWRTLQGGFIAPTLPPLAPAAGARTGMFVRWLAPGAIALAGQELLVADSGHGRLWRAEAGGGYLTGIAGVVVGPQTQLALGPDLSAWVLDPATRQLTRFGRDGRLMQSQHLGAAAGAPRALALADGGLTLLLADGVGASWTELRGVGGVARTLAPERAGGLRISGVDALAAGADGVFVLDQLLAVVHQVSREGAVLQTLGRGDLLQPVAVAVDRLQRCYVWDAQDGSVKRLQAGASALRWSAAELGVQQIGGIAVDGLTLAVSDALAGTVVLHSFAHEAGP
jgi:hypothetical protein